MKRSFTVFLIAAGALAGFAGSAAAQPGDLDPGFGESPGRTVVGGPLVSVPTFPLEMIDAGGGSTISAEYLGSDGDITRDFRAVVVKRGPDGTPDPAFGQNGTVLLPLVGGEHHWALNLAFQGDSLIVVSRGEGGRPDSVVVQRLDRNTGELDHSFGANGATTLKLSDFLNDEDGFFSYGVGVHQDGNIFVLASEAYGNPSLLIRLTPDGEVVRSFGANGAINLGTQAGCFTFDRITVTTLGALVYSYNCVRSYGADGDLRFSYRKTSDVPGDREIASIGESPLGGTLMAVRGDYDVISRILKLGEGGTLNPAFGTDGSVPAFPFNPDYEPDRFEIDPEGRFVIAGEPDDDNASDQGVMRILPDGSPDDSFGDGGVTVYGTPFPSKNTVTEVAAVADGIVVIGNTGYYHRTAVKVGNDGELSPEYGGDGLLEFRGTVPSDDRINDTLTLRNGETLAGGSSENQALFVKYLANGRLDPGFGQGGVLRQQVGSDDHADQVRNLNWMADGDLIACVESGRRAWVVRMNPDGTPDEEFGQDGMWPAGDLSLCTGIAPSGERVLVGGMLGTRRSVIRLSRDGSEDPSYGEQGVATALSEQWFRPRFAFYAFPDGSVLIAEAGTIARFDPDGKLDRSFGKNGISKFLDPKQGQMQWAAAIGVSKRGNVFVGGYTRGRSAIAKLTARGKPAKGFGTKGVRILSNPGSILRLTDLKVQSDGKVAMSAFSRLRRCEELCESMRVFRLNGRGGRDRNFANEGLYKLRLGANTRANSLSLSSYGLLAGGFTETSSGRNQALVIRLKR